jgi:hypothetical protein
MPDLGNSDVTGSVPLLSPVRSYNSTSSTNAIEADDMRDRSTGRAFTGRRLPSAVVAASCAAAIAACGSSDKPNPASASSDPLVNYARCIRVHGVPNFPDPSGSHGLAIPNDINPQSPAFKTAEQACAKLGRGGSGQGSVSESQKLQLLALAKCMRKHGVPNFADPTSSPPPPGNGNAIGGNGTYLAVGPPTSQQSPAFKHAAAACGIPGAP